MLRLGLASAQGHDRTPNCNCNELPAGRICGVPIKFSIFLLLYALYSSAGLMRQNLHSPWWVVVGLALGGLLLLVVTILIHEFGHGLTARRFGGEILYILLWPLGGICFHTMPRLGTPREKLKGDWWVAFNGPATHMVMVPVWAAVSALLFLAFGMRYSWADLWHNLNPLTSGGGLARHQEVMERGWGALLLLQLCATAISLNVLLFLFNILFPMYPMDSSKLLVTGLQLCGVPAQNAAWYFIRVSGTCALILLAATAFQVYQWVSRGGDVNHIVEMVSMGMIPVPLPILLTLGLCFWGGKQTWDLHQLAESKHLHQHPLFNHVPHVSRTVRDVANGRPDLFVETQVDDYDTPPPPPPQPQPQPAEPGRNYGAVRIVDGLIVR